MAATDQLTTTAARRWSSHVGDALLARLARRAAVDGRRRLTPSKRRSPASRSAACREARRTTWAPPAGRPRRPAGLGGHPVRARAAILLRFHDLVIANADEILDLIQLEIGKSRRHAYEEVLDTAITARYYAHTAAGFLRPRLRQGALPLLTMTREYRRPKGVVGFISPWNYPLMLSISDALAAIMAGNTVVIKPDSQTPFSALWVTRLLTRSGAARTASSRWSPDRAPSWDRR